MNSILLIVAALVACTYADVMHLPHDYAEEYPGDESSRQVRHPRDISWNRPIGGGNVFGTLGQNDDGLFGRGGYKKDIFNDERGRLQGQAYGSRVLGPNGDSTNFGGRFDWNDDNAKAAVDISKQVHGRTSVAASGAGVWKLDKDTTLSAGGAVVKELGHGRPDVALQAEIEHKF